MYRTTARAKQKNELFSKMGKASQKAQAEDRMLNGESSFWQPPEVRRVITITDYDCGEPVTKTMELRRSNRIDCYNCYVDGKLWKERIGWSRVLEWIRKAFPRVQIFD